MDHRPLEAAGTQLVHQPWALVASRAYKLPRAPPRNSMVVWRRTMWATRFVQAEGALGPMEPVVMHQTPSEVTVERVSALPLPGVYWHPFLAPIPGAAPEAAQTMAPLELHLQLSKVVEELVAIHPATRMLVLDQQEPTA